MRTYFAHQSHDVRDVFEIKGSRANANTCDFVTIQMHFKLNNIANNRLKKKNKDKLLKYVDI